MKKIFITLTIILFTFLIKAQSPLYKYVALLTQTGTLSPTAIVLENTFTFTPQWQRDDPGSYSCVNPAAPSSTLTFPYQKTTFICSPGYGLFRGMDFNYYSVELFVFDKYEVMQDDGLGQTYVEIRVYP